MLVPVCVICERAEGEDGAELMPINTDSCVVPLCDNCMRLSWHFALIKCRHCGAVATILKDQVPGGLALGQYTFIIFTEGCKFCGEGDAKN